MNKIYKTIMLPIKNSSKEDLDYLFECNRESARVWNECIRLNKEHWDNKNKVVDRKYLQDKIKGEFSTILTAHTMQIIVKKYLTALSNIRKARKVGRTDLKYPWKEKKNYNTLWDSLLFKINYPTGVIRLSKPRKVVNHKYIIEPLFLKFKPKSIPQNIVQIELAYNNGLQLAINYYTEEENIKVESNNICAVDLGEIHSIASIDNNGNSLIITGRKIRSEQRFRNKELGKLNRKLSKCKKDSRNYKKYRKAIRKLISKSRNKITNDLKKTAKLFSDYVITDNVSTVVTGDLKNFNMNQKYNKRKKGTRQRIIQWQHGRLIKLLHNKLDKYGILITEISEAYTSQTCPNCQYKHKPTGRNYVCPKCGFTMHRDVVGAYNILSKYLNNGKIKKMDLIVKPTKYLRIDC